MQDRASCKEEVKCYALNNLVMWSLMSEHVEGIQRVKHKPLELSWSDRMKRDSVYKAAEQFCLQERVSAAGQRFKIKRVARSSLRSVFLEHDIKLYIGRKRLDILVNSRYMLTFSRHKDTWQCLIEKWHAPYWIRHGVGLEGGWRAVVRRVQRICKTELS